jgi:hypothetical protein
MTRILPLFVLLLSCAGRDDGLDKYGRTPQLAARYKEAVENRTLLRGMHKDEIEEVMGGRPEKISKRNRGDREYTVWEYRSRSLDLYLDDDGYLMDWRGPF